MGRGKARHAALFPTGYSGLAKIKVDGWRDDSGGPMQVVSGPIGRKRVHFEAPPADRLEAEIRRFLHRAVDHAQPTLDAVMIKPHFWQRWAGMSLNLDSAVDRLNIAQIIDIVSYFLFYALTR